MHFFHAKLTSGQSVLTVRQRSFTFRLVGAAVAKESERIHPPNPLTGRIQPFTNHIQNPILRARTNNRALSLLEMSLARSHDRRPQLHSTDRRFILAVFGFTTLHVGAVPGGLELVSWTVVLPTRKRLPQIISRQGRALLF